MPDDKKIEDEAVITSHLTQLAKEDLQKQQAMAASGAEQKLMNAQFYTHIATLTYKASNNSYKVEENQVSNDGDGVKRELGKSGPDLDAKEENILKNNLNDQGVGTVSTTRNDIFGARDCVKKIVEKLPQDKNKKLEFLEKNPIIIRSNKTNFLIGAMQEAMHSGLKVEARSHKHWKTKASSNDLDAQGYSQEAAIKHPGVKEMQELCNKVHEAYKGQLKETLSISNVDKKTSTEDPDIKKLIEQCFKDTLEEKIGLADEKGSWYQVSMGKFNADKSKAYTKGAQAEQSLKELFKIAANDPNLAKEMLSSIREKCTGKQGNKILQKCMRKQIFYKTREGKISQKYKKFFGSDSPELKGLRQIKVNRNVATEVENTVSLNSGTNKLFDGVSQIKEFDSIAEQAMDIIATNNVLQVNMEYLAGEINNIRPETSPDFKETAPNFEEIDQIRDKIDGIFGKLTEGQQKELFDVMKVANSNKTIETFCEKASDYLKQRKELFDNPKENLENFRNEFFKKDDSKEPQQLLIDNCIEKSDEKMLNALLKAECLETTKILISIEPSENSKTHDKFLKKADTALAKEIKKSEKIPYTSILPDEPNDQSKTPKAVKELDKQLEKLIYKELDNKVVKDHMKNFSISKDAEGSSLTQFTNKLTEAIMVNVRGNYLKDQVYVHTKVENRIKFLLNNPNNPQIRIDCIDKVFKDRPKAPHSIYKGNPKYKPQTFFEQSDKNTLKKLIKDEVKVKRTKEGTKGPLPYDKQKEVLESIKNDISGPENKFFDKEGMQAFLEQEINKIPNPKTDQESTNTSEGPKQDATQENKKSMFKSIKGFTEKMKNFRSSNKPKPLVETVMTNLKMHKTAAEKEATPNGPDNKLDTSRSSSPSSSGPK